MLVDISRGSAFSEMFNLTLIHYSERHGTMKAVIGAVCLNALLHGIKHSHMLPDDLPRRLFQVPHHNDKTVPYGQSFKFRV